MQAALDLTASPAGAAPPSPDALARKLELALLSWRNSFLLEEQLSGLVAALRVGGISNLEVLPSRHGSLDDICRQRRELAGALVSDLVAAMKAAFVPSGIDLEVTRHDFAFDWEDVRDDRDGAFLVRIESDLRHRYAGCGERLALQQLARDLWRRLGLAHRQPGVDAKGIAVFTDRVTCEQDMMKPRRRLSYTDERYAQSLWDLLDAFLAQRERHEIFMSARRRLHEMSGWDGQGVTSREVIALTDGLELMTFFQKFEYRFSPDLAAELQVFFGEYGPAVVGDDD